MSSSHQPVNRSELDRFFADISPRIQLAQMDLAHGSSRPPVDQRELEQDQRELERFFADVNYRVHLAERLQCQLDKRLATRFNVFDLIEPDENKLSDVLAGLLNPKGAHGQGDLFFRCSSSGSALAQTPNFVQRTPRCNVKPACGNPERPSPDGCVRRSRGIAGYRK